jgi:RNA polymerase sigma factor (sigma-70 family)
VNRRGVVGVVRSMEGAEQLVADLRRPLVGALALYVGDRGVAEELAQEALARAWVDWDRVSRLDAPGAWVFRVAFNLARSRFRRLRAERRAHARLGPHDQDGGDHGAVVPAVLAVREAVRSLPPRYREVIACRYFAELTVAETAVAMRCAEGTVKSLSHKALSALREIGLVEVEADA